MNRMHTNQSRNRRVATRLALGAGLLASLAGVYAFRSLSARPGEGAFRLIPATALAVGSIDLTPSASQTIAFKHIDDALARNGMDGLMEKSVLDIFENGATGVEELKPLILRNGALAALPGPDGTMDNAKGLAILALSDGPAAQAILIKSGTAQYYKGTRYFKLKRGNSNLMVVDNLLLVAQEPATLLQVLQVQKGTQPSIESNALFAGARSHVSDDANIKFFVSPKVWEMRSGSGQLAENFRGASKDWMSVGIAIRDGGIGISYAGVVDTQKMPEYVKMGQTPAIRSDLFHVLPSGAYGAIVMSDPANYVESFRTTLDKDKQTRKAMVEMEDSLQKEVGLDFEKDVMPAFRGNVVTAAYPDASNAGVDALIVIDDQNDGDPANAVERFQNWVKRQVAKEGNQQGPLWTEKTVNNNRFFRLTDDNQTEMRKSLSQGMDESNINKQSLVGSKTIAWAMVGKAVFASTSQELLDRAVANYQNPGAGLDTDPKFAAHEKELLDGSQQLMMFSLSRIAEGVRNTVRTTKMDADGRKVFESVVSAFEKLNDPLTIRGQVQPDGRMSGGAFIPLDYDKLLDFAGDMKNKH